MEENKRRGGTKALLEELQTPTLRCVNGKLEETEWVQEEVYVAGRGRRGTP